MYNTLMSSPEPKSAGSPNLPRTSPPPTLPPKPVVTSLLDVMEDGREFSSLLQIRAHQINLILELRRAIAEIEKLRQRPLLCYVSNVLRAGDFFTSIELAD